ncbi:unnamed protein product [Blepharisma stoltei]|uniref:Transmembrane protein 230 n=1 Tax=Blepharisma stoltei TaxID=1481888 RepID=A0AAU9ILV5_9CILI|nr:unnamed protein product [Blepharisma stoltei]
MASRDYSETKSEPDDLTPQNNSKENSAEKFEIEETSQITELVSYRFPYGKVILTISLLIAIVSLIVIGIIEQAKANFVAVGIPYWIIAFILTVPWTLYFVNLVRFYRAHPLERNRILNEIPDI